MTTHHCLKVFCDSNLAGDPVDRRSTTGMVYYLYGNVITWCSQKQRGVALSSCEAEFMAATSAACQGIWLMRLLRELLEQPTKPFTLFVDNKSAIALMKNPMFHCRSKHIDTRYYFIRECIEEGLVAVSHIATESQRHMHSQRRWDGLTSIG